MLDGTPVQWMEKVTDEQYGGVREDEGAQMRLESEWMLHGLDPPRALGESDRMPAHQEASTT